VSLLLQIALVCIGSVVGGLARWGLSEAAARLFGKGFPWGTFIINVSGCFVLGWFATLVGQRLQLGADTIYHLRLLVAYGFCGGYTTFSTYELESHNLLGDGDGMRAILYLSLSVVAGLLAVRLGALVALCW
jgi:CrcB protein